jgi:hypothetical protein
MYKSENERDINVLDSGYTVCKFVVEYKHREEEECSIKFLY